MKKIRRLFLELPEIGDVVFKKYGKVISALSDNLEYQYETETGYTLNYKFDGKEEESGYIEII